MSPVGAGAAPSLELVGESDGGFHAGGRVDMAYSLPMPGRVVITVHDVLGRTARVLVDGDNPAGEHTVTWDGTDYRGVSVASGVYFARMVYGSEVQTLRIVLVK